MINSGDYFGTDKFLIAYLKTLEFLLVCFVELYSSWWQVE